MTAPVIELEIDVDGWPEDTDLVSRMDRLITHVTKEIRAEPCDPAVVLFSDDATVRDLNARFRNKNKPTNVLSFPAPETETYPGDIVLALETCIAEAKERDISLLDHATHLVLHGFLHLYGYDHGSDEEAALMEGLETKVLKELGLHNPYAPR